jgi:hypothetical protein
MKNYNLYFTDKSFETGLQHFKCDKKFDLLDKIDELCCGKSSQVVYLLFVEECNFTFIGESHMKIQEIIEKMKIYRFSRNFHLHQYRSYEDAYSVGLLMNAKNNLCYN